MRYRSPSIESLSDIGIASDSADTNLRYFFDCIKIKNRCRKINRKGGAMVYSDYDSMDEVRHILVVVFLYRVMDVTER